MYDVKLIVGLDNMSAESQSDQHQNNNSAISWLIIEANTVTLAHKPFGSQQTINLTLHTVTLIHTGLHW